MTGARGLQIELLQGAPALLAEHARELPQRDDLCGAFCGALALHAAGAGEGCDQDAVALAAGSIVSAVRDPGTLPFGEAGRRDYRLALPSVADSAVSGTTAAGVVNAINELGHGDVVAIPLAGPWPVAALDGLFDLAAELARPVTLIANLATRHLWGARPGMAAVLDQLLRGEADGPAPDWDVGHFVCIVGRISNPARPPGGALYLVADTYPALGMGGVHLQPPDRLAAAIERRDMPAGGVIAVVASDDAAAVRARAEALGVSEAMWDNGTLAAGAAA